MLVHIRYHKGSKFMSRACFDPFHSNGHGLCRALYASVSLESLSHLSEGIRRVDVGSSAAGRRMRSTRHRLSHVHPRA